MLLSLSIVVSLFGIVNTLVLTVFERTRELGMLRAIGMSRRQVRRMIRYESVITALLGATFGIPLGILLAALIGATIDFGTFTVPIGTLIVFVIAAVITGLIAAIWPARRAGKLNVLAALSYGSRKAQGETTRRSPASNSARLRRCPLRASQRPVRKSSETAFTTRSTTLGDIRAKPEVACLAAGSSTRSG